MSAPVSTMKMAQAAPRPTSAPFLQRKCACGNTASAADGECEACKRRDALGLQARLSIGASNDPLEHEADRAADQVMRMGTVDGALSRSVTPRLTRRGPSVNARAGEVPASVDRTLSRGGEPLASSARAFFEPRFAHDFSRVRVHRDAASAASARDVSAHAYTVGHHLVFAAGRYAPGTAAGLSLRREQVDALRGRARADFEARMQQHLRRHFPRQCEALDADELRAVFEHGQARARRYGLQTEAEQAKYLSLMFAFGRDFDVEQPWAVAVLGGGGTGPALLERLYGVALVNENRALGRV